ncbi:unnamed protein product (macronuclear) [Paramecium tetraurelia]|uniref:Prefoldin subunit 4 n=1 Tax=Paramecium tetraurelia TaxID=5888 RepID=A0BQ01_PARTE|nr:uncharacterized protein GSPATT00005369001 [Paramecium tetraurelia]CAK60618.1 unnamed protein product [Paramecium tetraurelia]|eukprot:XP_001428016.1 hypothetical protein (macronuclear) [Paramecium tetraurelia strain d4-2]
MKFTSTDNIEVDRQDQQKINTFSRLNMQYHELIRLNQARKDELTRLSDGKDEMELMDDDEKIPFKFGDSFIRVSVDKARTLIDEQVANVKKQFEEDTKKIEETHKQMNNLKAKLYAKFGSQINLDDQ